MKYYRWTSLNLNATELDLVRERNKINTKTYKSEDSLVVTRPTTNSPAWGIGSDTRG
jgi:hypothetical protein